MDYHRGIGLYSKSYTSVDLNLMAIWKVTNFVQRSVIEYLKDN